MHTQQTAGSTYEANRRIRKVGTENTSSERGETATERDGIE